MQMNVRLGKNCEIQKNVFLGMPSREYLGEKEKKLPSTNIGDDAVLRSGTIIYCDVTIGNKFQSGHNVLIREHTSVGSNVLIGTNSIVEGRTKIGSNVSIQSCVYIPLNTVIGDKVFIGPNVVLTNDKYPLRIKSDLKGPIIKKGASIGANSTILSGIEIGQGAIVAAGSVVTMNVPPWKLIVGVPARIKDLPEDLRKVNFIG